MCSILIISNVSAEDEGNYICLAETMLGNDNATITLSYSGRSFTSAIIKVAQLSNVAQFDRPLRIRLCFDNGIYFTNDTS